jgi:2-polyprenyl-6-methoxyphenol hydroxylase-like FAD-dependent oxidoreductase
VAVSKPKKYRLSLNNEDFTDKGINDISLGYSLCFLNRQDLIRVLYAAIKDKSKIRTTVEIVDVLELGSRVRVLTRDGSEYLADILVGADGVRSQVRNELWRVANDQEPGYIPSRDKSCASSFHTGHCIHYSYLG